MSYLAKVSGGGPNVQVRWLVQSYSPNTFTYNMLFQACKAITLDVSLLNASACLEQKLFVELYYSDVNHTYRSCGYYWLDVSLFSFVASRLMASSSHINSVESDLM